MNQKQENRAMNESTLTTGEGTSNALVEAESARAIQEVQAAVVMAKKFPRDEEKSAERILVACRRPALAVQAMFTYPRGSTMVEGPSIRLAEAAAKAWGNLQVGTRELSREGGSSTVEAYAWDLETNTRISKVFQVPHERSTKSETVYLTDSRDIYEAVANQGARRLRTCILSLIPGDVIDEAVIECKKTQERMLKEAPEEKLKKVVAAFAEIGVTQQMIEGRLRHKLSATKVGEVFTLHKVYQAIQDGMSSVEEAFPQEESQKRAGGGFFGGRSRSEASGEAAGEEGFKE